MITSKLSGMVPFGPEGFQPIAQGTQNTTVLVVRDDSPFATLPALMAEAKTAPGSLRLGVPLGTPPHYTAKELQRTTPGAEFNFIQAMGAQKRYALLLGGHIDVTIFTLAELVSYRAAPGGPLDRQIRALAVLLPERHPVLPDVPTAIESGFDVLAGNGLYWWAPKDTPRERIDVLAAAIGAALATPSAQEEMKALTLDTKFRRGEELDRWIESRIRTLSEVAFDSNLKLPNLPLYCAIIVGSLGVVLLVFPAVRDTPSVAAFPVDAKGRHVALICAGLVLAYILTLSSGVAPYAVATTTMVFLVGGMIAEWDRRQLPALLELALLTGLGTELVFTQFFSLVLP